jgi:D-tyrosyl-tRNA(Tyr) deacylase
MAESFGSSGFLTTDARRPTPGAPILVVSRFTLYANTAKGRRPTWNAAAPGAVAEPW